MTEADVISRKLCEVLILDKRGLARGHLFVVKVLTTSRNKAKKFVLQIVKEKMADTYSYISGELLCALFPLFVDGIFKKHKEEKF